MDARNRNNGAFDAICLRFRRHLREQQEHKEDFLEYYLYWEKLRRDTIEALEELAESACKRQRPVNNIKCGAKLVAAAGNAVFMVGCVTGNPVIAIPGKVLATVGHGVASGTSAANSSLTARLKKKATQFLEDDLNERNGLVALGLEYNITTERVLNVIESFREVGISDILNNFHGCIYGLDELVHNLGEINMHGGNFARDIVIVFMEFFARNVDGIEIATDLLEILKKYSDANAESLNAAFSCLEFAFDVNTLYTWANESQGILGALGCGPLSQFINGYFIYRDVQDVAGIFTQICNGSKSETAEEIYGILKILKAEAELMEKIYNALK